MKVLNESDGAVHGVTIWTIAGWGAVILCLLIFLKLTQIYRITKMDKFNILYFYRDTAIPDLAKLNPLDY